MSHPGEALQRAVYAALTGHSGLTAAMGGAVRAYDRVPPSPGFPYLYIADLQLLDDGNQCEPDAYVAYQDVHVWSRGAGLVACKRISAQVREAIAAMTVTGWNASVWYESERHMNDGDGLTGHAVVTFKIQLEPA